MQSDARGCVSQLREAVLLQGQQQLFEAFVTQVGIRTDLLEFVSDEVDDVWRASRGLLSGTGGPCVRVEGVRVCSDTAY